MKGRILGDSCNKFLNFIAGTGTSVAIIPQSLAERNKLKIVPVDPDEPEYEGITGMRLTVVGQTECARRRATRSWSISTHSLSGTRLRSKGFSLERL